MNNAELVEAAVIKAIDALNKLPPDAVDSDAFIRLLDLFSQAYELDSKQDETQGAFYPGKILPSS